MVLLVDAGALYVQADRAHPQHAAVAAALRSEREALVVSALAVAEADYLILTRLGVDVELAFLEDLAAGDYQAEWLTADELRAALDVVRRYRDLRVGLADASTVVLAQRFGARRILTFDERAFRAMTPLQGGAFTLLPADAEGR